MAVEGRAAEAGLCGDLREGNRLLTDDEVDAGLLDLAMVSAVIRLASAR
jgi:hypothetical protein